MIVPLLGRRQDAITLTPTQVQVLVEIEPLLRAARLHLACPRCLAAGHGPNAVVGGSNGPTDTTWTVDCHCTTRRFDRGPQGNA